MPSINSGVQVAMMLSVGGSSFLRRITFTFLRAWEIHLISGGVLGHRSSYPSSEDQYLFENGRTYFHGNQFPNAVFRNRFHKYTMTFLDR